MVTLENPLCAGTKRFDHEGAIFQPFDFHFLIAVATEAVAQLQIKDQKNSSQLFSSYVDFALSNIVYFYLWKKKNHFIIALV